MNGTVIGKREVFDTAAQVQWMAALLDPVLVPLHEVPDVYDSLVETKKLIDGAVLRMTTRYEESGAWRRNGSDSAEDDVAKKTGSSKGAARKRMATSKRLREQPKTEQAVKQGELSEEQAAEVSSGADASPEDERNCSPPPGPSRCGDMPRRPGAAPTPAPNGAAEGRGSADEDGEPVGADADATEDAAGDGGAPARRARNANGVRPDRKVLAVIDVRALNRGHVEGDETCEIAGVGRVSVSAIRSMLSDAFLALVIKDGADVRNVTHLGRKVTAQQRTALEARGWWCERCGSTYRVEIDHDTGWTLTHDTVLGDLRLACEACHDLKTLNQLRWTGPPGEGQFVDQQGNSWRAPPDRAGTGPPTDEPDVPRADGSCAGARNGPQEPPLFTLAD